MIFADFLHLVHFMIIILKLKHEMGSFHLENYNWLSFQGSILLPSPLKVWGERRGLFFPSTSMRQPPKRTSGVPLHTVEKPLSFL